MSSSLTKKQQDEVDNLIATGIKTLLENIEKNPVYNTNPSYVANDARYPNQQMPFVDKHILYLVGHPNVDRKTYISNLRLMLRCD